MPITKFAAHIINIMSEYAEFKLPSKAEQAELNQLFLIDQQVGLFRGLEYCEQEFLTQDVKQVTELKFENFIKQLHKHLSHSLTILNSEGKQAGQYCTTEHLVLKETGLPDKEYKGVNEPEHDANIIKFKYGEQAKKNYLDFVSKFLAVQGQIADQGNAAINKGDIKTGYNLRQYSKSSTDQIVKKEGLGGHPGYRFYCGTTHFILPAPIEQAMQNYCNQIIKLLNQHNVDPLKIAAEVLKIAYIQPFDNGNDKLAMVLCNSFLMLYDIEAVDFNDHKEAFYLAIQNSAHDPLALYHYLKIKVQESRNAQKLNVQVAKSAFRWPVINADVYSYPNRYEVKDLSTSKVTIFNATYCEQKANVYGQPIHDAGGKTSAVYYAVRAADFYLAENKKELAARMYMQAAQLSISLRNFDNAYDYAKKSQDLCASVAASGLLNTLNFVDAAAVSTKITQNLSTTQYRVEDINLAFRTGATVSDIEKMTDCLSKGAKINDAGKDSGKTALHRAYQNNQEAAITFLLNNGANPNIKDNAGKLPADYAQLETNKVSQKN